MVVISKIPIAEGLDEVTLIVKDGSLEIHVEELGDLSGKCNYEFVCGISKRVPRVYLKEGRVVEQADYFE